MIPDDPVLPNVFMGTVALWGLFCAILGYFVGGLVVSRRSYDAGLEEGRRRYLKDAAGEVRRRRAAEAAEVRRRELARDLHPIRLRVRL